MGGDFRKLGESCWSGDCARKDRVAEYSIRSVRTSERDAKQQTLSGTYVMSPMPAMALGFWRSGLNLSLSLLSTTEYPREFDNIGSLRNIHSTRVVAMTRIFWMYV